MKSILLSGTAALLLVAASGAYAQSDQHQNDNHAGASDNHAGSAMTGDQHNDAGGNHGAMTGNQGAMGADHSATTTHSTTHTTTHRTRHRTTHTTTTPTNNGNNNGADHNNNNNDHNNNNNNDHNPGNDNTHADNGHPHGQLDVSLRISVNATHHFRGPTWHAPAGYTYRRYSVGARLEPAFYARDYWLTDYASFDLIAPPDGYTWVRFGPDAILIDEDTGEVARVVYGVFTG